MLHNHFFATILLSMLGASISEVRGDAVMRSTNSDYPIRLLRHTVTEITVDVRGLVAETRAYAEFRNDFDHATDAVYSFPLPDNAHVTRLQYSKGDTISEAVLQELAQTTLPGTGEGGFAAELNEYLGKNKVTLQVHSIPAAGVSKIEIRYIQKLDLEAGRIVYFYPLETKQFMPDVLNHFSITINVWNPWTSQKWGSDNHQSGWMVLHNDASLFSVKREEAKAFLERDFIWGYSPTLADFSVKSQSVKNPDSAGYVLASLLPPIPGRSTSTPRSVLFLIDKSRSMTGFKLQQSVEAVKACLSLLTPQDDFAVGVFDFNETQLVPFQPPTVDAKATAIGLLDSLAKGIGISASSLTNGLNAALKSFPSGASNPQIFLFSDGFSEFRTDEMEKNNATPIFAIGLGRELNRARLEAASGFGNGITVYFRENEDILSKGAAFFQGVSGPAMTSATLSGPAGQLANPSLAPASQSLWAWGGTTLTARYLTGGPLDITLNGKDGSTDYSKSYPQALAIDTSDSGAMIAMRYWASEQIRTLESQIDLNGMNQTARSEAVRISLLYKVKSRYTSYQAEIQSTPGDPTIPVPAGLRQEAGSFSAASSKLQVEKLRGGREISIQLSIPPGGISPEASLAIYDMHGRLIRQLRKFNGNSGMIKWTWDGRDQSGNPASGTVFVVVRVGNRILTHILQPGN
ncbi:MAG: VIT domain-containing protein [Fibrobacteria bacterium]